MPAADAVLLPLCIGLSLIGVLVVAFGWRRGNRGRILQGVALALAPTALFFTGLLSLLWAAAVATVGWASRILFTPSVWFGIGLLGVCLVLWVVGGLLVRRDAGRAPIERQKAKSLPASRTGQPAAGTTTAPKGRGAAPAPVDDDMAEIEAILKNRGIN